MGEYSRQWHEDRQYTGELNGLSYDREELLIKKIERSKLATIPLEEITEEDIDAYKRENAKNGESKNEQDRLLKKVKQILRHAETRRKIKYDPSRVIKDVQTEKKPRRSLTMKQQAALLKSLEEEDRDGRHAAIVIALATGLRRGEILGLQWRHFDGDKETLTIEQQMNASGKITEPKYESRGTIPLDAATALYLKLWQHSIRQAKTGKAIDDIPICCNSKYGYYLPSNFDRWRRRYFVDHGLGIFNTIYTTRDAKGNVRKHYKDYEGYNLHELRHTAATELIGSGADLHTVQAIMRHRKISTTEQYLHDIPENLSQAVDAVAQKRRDYDEAKEHEENRRKRRAGKHLPA